MGRCCCGEGCIFCADDFDRSDDTDPTTSAPSGCSWTEGGGNGWSISSNELVHSGATASHVSFDLGGAADSWVAQIVFEPPVNNGEFVGMYFTTGSHLVVECEFDATAGYDALSLVRYSALGVEEARWVIVGDIVSGTDVTMCVTRVSGDLAKYEVAIENAASTYTFTIDEYPNGGSANNTCGIIGKGSQTVKSFLWTDDTGEIDCNTCTPKCNGFDFDDTFDAAPLRPAYDANGAPPDSFNAGHARWEADGQSAGNSAGNPLAAYFCNPDWNEISSLNFEAVFDRFSDGGCSDNFLRYEILLQLMEGPNVTDFGPWVRMGMQTRVGGTYPDGTLYCRYVNTNDPADNELDQDDTVTANYGDTLRIEVTNPTNTVNAFVIKYYLNGVLQFTQNSKPFGPIGVDSAYWIWAEAWAQFSCLNNDASGHYIELDRWRVYTT